MDVTDVVSELVLLVATPGDHKGRCSYKYLHKLHTEDIIIIAIDKHGDLPEYLNFINMSNHNTGQLPVLRNFEQRKKNNLNFINSSTNPK